MGVVRVLVLSAALALAAGVARASIAMPPPPHVIYERAEVVFVGVVTEVGPAKMQVRPVTVLKGKPAATVTVGPVHYPSCMPGTNSPPAFEAGERVLVAAKSEGSWYRFVNHMVGDAKLPDAAKEKSAVNLARRMLAIAALPTAEERGHALVALLTSDDAVLADAGTQFLRELRSPAKARPFANGLVKALAADGTSTRRAALTALRGVAPAGAFEKIAACVGSSDQGEAVAACGAIAPYDRVEAVRLVRAAADRIGYPYVLASLGSSPRQEAREILQGLIGPGDGTDFHRHAQRAGLRGYALRLETFPATQQDVDDLVAFACRGPLPVERSEFVAAFRGTRSRAGAVSLIALIRDPEASVSQRSACYAALHALATRKDDPQLGKDVIELLRGASKPLIRLMDGGDHDLYLCWLLRLIHTPQARAALQRVSDLDPPNWQSDATRTLMQW